MNAAVAVASAADAAPMRVGAGRALSPGTTRIEPGVRLEMTANASRASFMTQSVAVSPDGRHAYAVAWINGALTVFDRLADGTLRQKPGIPGCFSSRAAELQADFCAPVTALQGAASVAVSPDGRNVYVASLMSSAVPSSIVRRTAR